MGKIPDIDVQSAFKRVVEEYYKPEEFDQVPFKFPEETSQSTSKLPNWFYPDHTPLETTLKSIQQTENVTKVFETATKNITELATSNVTEAIFTQETSTGTAIADTNLTAVINEVFVSATSTETPVTTLTPEIVTDFNGNSTESTSLVTLVNSTESTDLVTFVNSTLREVGTTYAPEHVHHGNNTAVIILSILVCVLVVSIIVGFSLYYRKKKMIKNAGSFEVASQSPIRGSHIVSFSENKSCQPGSSQKTDGNDNFYKSSQL